MNRVNPSRLQGKDMRSLRYEIALPDDYDMNQIRDRVEQRGHLFEEVPGLAIKAFMVQSHSQGAARNVYAPLYFWNSHQALSDFTAGPLFAGLIDSFGRPSAADHQVLAFDIADRSALPGVATIEAVDVDASMLPGTFQRLEEKQHRAALTHPGLFAAATLLDTRDWVATRVRLWANSRSVQGVGPQAERFTVLRTVGPALTHHSHVAFET